jgi:Kef-type K+ transport system membrane component KefB
MHVILYLSIILFSGIILSKLASLFKLPNVTGYLIAGILVGPSIFNIVTADVAFSLRVISDVALAFIAFSIGSQLDFLQLKKVGSGIMIITILEASGAVYSR